MQTLKHLAERQGYDIRHYSQPLKPNEEFTKAIKPFDFSQNNGGTLNAFHYYNDFYLYPQTQNS